MVFGGKVNFTKYRNNPGYAGIVRSRNQIDLYSISDTYINRNPRLIVHELGHAFDNALCDATVGCAGPGQNPGRNSLDNSLITNYGDTGNGYNGYYHGHTYWQHRNEHTAGENFADMFVGWTYGRWWNDRGSYLVDLSDEREAHMNQSRERNHHRRPGRRYDHR